MTLICRFVTNFAFIKSLFAGIPPYCGLIHIGFETCVTLGIANAMCLGQNIKKRLGVLIKATLPKGGRRKVTGLKGRHPKTAGLPELPGITVIVLLTT